MVVAHILGQQPLEVLLIQDDHVVEQVSSASSDPALRDAVLPRTAKGSAGGVASRSNQDERFRPPRPERFQGDPEQLVQSCQSTARSFGVQSNQLLTESEIFKDQVFSGTESTDNPSQEMSERRDDGKDHVQHLIQTHRIKLVSKSFILRVHEVLTRDRSVFHSNARQSMNTTAARLHPKLILDFPIGRADLDVSVLVGAQSDHQQVVDSCGGMHPDGNLHGNPPEAASRMLLAFLMAGVEEDTLQCD
jgi:hypothetical protein